MAGRDDAETWALSDDLLEAALVRLRQWSSETYGDLMVPQQVEHRFILTVTRF
jgi:hypothetical protein